MKDIENLPPIIGSGRIRTHGRFFAANAGFPKLNCIRTDGLEPRPRPALWTHDSHAEPVRDLQIPRQLSHGGVDQRNTGRPPARSGVHTITTTACLPEGGDPETQAALGSGTCDLVAWLLPRAPAGNFRVGRRLHPRRPARSACTGKRMSPHGCLASSVWRAWSCSTISGVCACQAVGGRLHPTVKPQDPGRPLHRRAAIHGSRLGTQQTRLEFPAIQRFLPTKPKRYEQSR